MRRRHTTAPWEAEPERPPTETRIPARPADLVSDLLVPIGQAAVTGILLGTVLTAGTVLLWPELDVNPLGLWAALTLGILTLAWLVLLLDHRRMLWAVERLINSDLDRDGARGEPEPQERIVVVNAAQSARRAEQQALAQRRSEFARFVSRIPVKGTSQRAWEGEIGREQYQEWRDVLLQCRWAEWNSTKSDGTPNERKGWKLIADVDYILERIG